MSNKKDIPMIKKETEGENMGPENLERYDLVQMAFVDPCTADLDLEICALKSGEYEGLASAMQRIPMLYGNEGRKRLRALEREIEKEYENAIKLCSSYDINRFSKLHRLMILMYPMINEETGNQLDFKVGLLMKSRVNNFNVGTLKNWMEQGHRDAVIDYLKSSYIMAEIVNKKELVERYHELVYEISLDLIKDVRSGKTPYPEREIQTANELLKMINWPTLSEENIESIIDEYNKAK